MTTTARNWIPPGALDDEALADAISALARAWAARWFTPARAVSIRRQSRLDFRAPSEAAYLKADDIFACIDRAQNNALACLLLGHPRPTAAPVAADQALFASIGAAAVGDLLRDICRDLLGTAATTQTPITRDLRRPFRFTLTIGGGPILEVLLTEAAAVSARRRLTNPCKATLPLASRQQSVAPAELRVGARLGGARLTLAEFATLERGDVLILDRAEGDDVELTVNDQIKAAQCTLCLDSGQPQLRLTQI